MQTSMRGIAAWFLTLFAIALSPSLAHAESAADRAARVGTTMFWLDRAAWVASDDIVTRLPKERGPEVGGWIVVAAANGYHVYFHGKGAAADSIIYEADVLGNQVSNAVVRAKADPPALPAQAAAMAKAVRLAWQELALHPDWTPCADAHFNTIAMPPDADGSVSVYFLTPQTMTGSFPFGGHFEIVVSAAGQVVSSRRFTNSCLTLSKGPNPADVKGAGMYMTHLLDAQPTEIHVFQQFATGLPVFVAIQSTKAIWKVEDGVISLEQAPK